MLTREQKDRLAYLHAYEWEGDKEKLSKALNAINSPEELWYASFIVRWSPEEGDLKFFYKHELCDRGLAMFLYWALSNCIKRTQKIS